MVRYPFVVNRRKAVVVEAETLANATDRVTTRYPNKWIKTTYARNVNKHLNNKYMDLVSAQKDAAKLSKAKKNQLVYIVLEEDEFKVTTDVDIDKDDIYSTWRGGVKIDSPKENKSETEIENKMETKTKIKKAVKKVAAKKSAPVKKVVTKDKVRPLDAPIKGGAALLILQALKKKTCTLQDLAKAGDTKETNVGWYLNKIRNNGHKVTLGEKGYSLK